MPKLPLVGEVRKGPVVGLAVGGVGIAAYLVYRNKRAKAATASAQAASGYGYGVAPSAAYGYGNGYYGYGQQSAYGYGASGGFPAGYYGYGVPNPPGGGGGGQVAAATTNAQWAQAAITQLADDGYDRQSVAGALGAYELGQPVTPDQQSIIAAAIGIEGYPPVPGASGNPPGINVQGTPGGGGGGGQGGGGGGKAVPNEVGKRADQALAAVRAAGFKAKTVPIRVPTKTYIVTSQSPSGTAPAGSLVTLNVQPHKF